MSLAGALLSGDVRALARAISLAEDRDPQATELAAELQPHTGNGYLVGLTGAPGTGKSTLADALVRVVRDRGQTVGVIAVDPSSPFTGGAVLGDRIRMSRHTLDKGVFIRSMGARGHLGGLAAASREAIHLLDAYGRDVILVETVGVGQSELEISSICDTVVLVLMPESGDAVQTIKAGILEIADVFVINKVALRGAEKRQLMAIRRKTGYEEWATRYRAGKRAPKEAASTMSGVPVNPLYTPEDLADWSYDRQLGYPGEYPFTRGVYPSMYRGQLWTIRQFAGYGTAEETNRRYKFLLSQGQAGLSVAFDMPTLMGYDSDDPLSRGEVGHCGVAIDSLEDMETLFSGIELDQITTSMTINSPAAILYAMYVAVGEKQGHAPRTLGGTLQNDILKEYIAQKEYIFPPEPSMRLVVDTIVFAARNMPRWNAVSISGYHIREAGSTAVQELAFTLADGMAYVEASVRAGLSVDEFAPRLSFFFDSHIDFFEEIAKFRAARRLWARIMRDKYGARDPRSWMLRFHTQTAGVSLTRQQVENNISRTAYEAMAAVLGGTNSLHTNSMDEVLALPTERAAQIALRTQQVLAHETGITNTIDPLAGSFFLERLTDEMEHGAQQYFDRIDEQGGVLPCIEYGFFQR